MVFFNCVKAQDFIYDKLAYRIISDDEVALLGNASSSNYNKEWVVPEFVNGYKVTEIECWVGEAGYERYAEKYVTSITLPNTVRVIQESAFYGFERLENINLPNSIEYIGIEAFYGCTSLKSITIPEKVTKLPRSVFYGCSNLASIKFPNSLKVIDGGAFSETAWLKNQPYGGVYVNDILYYWNNNENEPTTYAEIKEGTRFICQWAFSNATSVEEISFPNSVEEIGAYAFNNTQWYKNQLLPLYVNKVLVKGAAPYEIAEGTIAIAGSAFEGNSEITSINLPNSLKYIGEAAFNGCYNLNTITIPASVERIGFAVFTDAIANSITVDEKNPYFCSIDGILYDKDKSTLLACPMRKTRVESIPLTCKTIAYGACKYMDLLSSISIPASVYYISYANFARASSKCNITLPSRCYTCTPDYTSIKTTYSTQPLRSVMSSASLNGQYLELSQNSYYHKWRSTTTAKDIVGKEAIPNEIIRFNNLQFVDSNYQGDYLASSFYFYYNYSSYGYKANKFRVIDSEHIYNPQNSEVEELTYNRNFANNNWNALYIPFSMQYADWAEDFEVARLNDVHQFDDDEDGVVDRTVLELIKLKDGSVTEPNTPYMIKAKETGEKTIKLTDATLYATEENSFDVTSWFTKFTFTGTYSTVTDMATKGHYALVDGALMQASSDAATLGAFRWYLDITDRNGNPAPLKAKKVFLSFDDGETTAINLVEANDNSNAGSIYSISGVKVGTGKASLSKGLYISNGKKFLVK